MMKDIFNDMMAPSGAEVSIIPVMQTDGVMQIDEAQLPDYLPILALRNAVIFPGTVYPITIGREKSIRLIEDAERNNTFIGAVPQNDLSVEDPRKEDLYGYGTVAKIVKTLEMPDGTITAILQGYQRFEIEDITEYNPYLLGRVRYLNDFVPEEDTKVRMIAETLKEKAAMIIKSSTFVPREAAAALKSIAKSGKKVLFVATKKQAKQVIADKATAINMPYVIERWPGGMLTNFPTIRKAVKKMTTIDKMTKDGTFDNLSKREKLQITRQRAKLEKTLGSIADLNRLPAALFVVDVLKEHIAVREANRLGIPVFAMVDTNSDPSNIDFVIPANDDASKSIEVILDALCGAMAEGIEERKIEKLDETPAEEAAPKRERKARISRRKNDEEPVAEKPAESEE